MLEPGYFYRGIKVIIQIKLIFRGKLLFFFPVCSFVGIDQVWIMERKDTLYKDTLFVLIGMWREENTSVLVRPAFNSFLRESCLKGPWASEPWKKDIYNERKPKLVPIDECLPHSVTAQCCFLYLAHRMETKLSVLYVSKTNLLKHYELWRHRKKKNRISTKLQLLNHI